MPRRSPAAVRAALPHRNECTAITGLSAATVREIRHCERTRLSPGAVARALSEWRSVVHSPRRRLQSEAFEAGCPCCDPLEHRQILAEALACLPRPARRELQAQVTPLDELFERRTLSDPTTAPHLPWWQRRT
jgi:hypothetical protein